jgi:hypothetical protein
LPGWFKIGSEKGEWFVVYGVVVWCEMQLLGKHGMQNQDIQAHQDIKTMALNCRELTRSLSMWYAGEMNCAAKKGRRGEALTL